jgi:GT2 family glycosyltransferase/glycosyltransferase involved in cell wall biosynthesis
MIGRLFSRHKKIQAERRRLFNPVFYIYTYADIAREKIDPLHHFLEFGWKEGRDPSPTFSTLFYLDRYMRGATSSKNPLDHYIREGRSSGYVTQPTDGLYRQLQAERVGPHFDAAFYRSFNEFGLDGPPGSDLVGHYLDRGWREGHEPHPSFCSESYLVRNPHARAADVSPFYHYLVTRERLRPEVTSTTPIEVSDGEAHRERKLRLEAESLLEGEIDEAFYRATYPDVAARGLSPVRHYVRRGWREGRNPTRSFWTNYYLARYGKALEPGVNPFAHYVRTGRALGHKPNPVGAELWPEVVAPSREAWDALDEGSDDAPPVVSIIMPVYRGRDDTLAAIYSVLAAAQATPFELLIINDKSPDSDLTAELRALQHRKRVRYFENPANLGFVGTINRALGLTDRDVVLLNSDTVVYGDWLDRLLAHAEADPAIATITPLSNNATICSYPALNHNNMFALETSLGEIDRFASICNRGRRSDVPTGVGFCFYIRRRAIEAIGRLDEAAFGKGYGEENDFCMRAAKLGFTNKLAHDVLVRHTGQVSFTELGITEFTAGQTALSRKHPDYGVSVFRHVAVDPARESRLRLDAYRLFAHLRPRIAFFVIHSLTGGVLTHVEDMARRLRAEGVNVVYLKTGLVDGNFVELAKSQSTDIHVPNLFQFPLEKHRDLFADLLEWMDPEFIHIHSLATMNWNQLDLLMTLIRASGKAYYMTMHDYSSFCHRYNLVMPDAKFCGIPTTDVCRTCARIDQDAVVVVDPDIRRSTYARLMAQARRVFVPSRDTARRLKSVFPDQVFEVRPHAEELPETPWPAAPPRSERRTIVAIGAVGPGKGSGLLHALALDARQRDLPLAYRIVGYSDIPGLLADAGITETGEYADEAEALAAIARIQPDLCFLSTIWPETFSYALSLMLAAGIPAVAFDIGAPNERLSEMEAGVSLPIAWVNNPQAINDRLLSLDLDDLWAKRQRPRPFRYRSILSDYYGI